ncbi:LysR family transcriptional regulator [Francisella sp. Scap27]|uniref:LysR substrate-binding domain-containing protein n=1 Tax=Francisella sp. Scap27 TaxID=2589986 RepID=UPI0015B853D9|nr:LysR substrate-binding domain-containing protein [Francisella sp. Scap27]QLE79517.1 LysR family transcriptional regulator [Francisella sp. Scap27]
MKISLKQLQVFVNTAKTESISTGAERCFISQAAASMSISQLENLLGSTLFDRVGKRIRLNSNGESLLAKAIQILDQVEEFEAFALNDNSLSGKLVIGASTTIANYLLPKYIAKFKELYPQVHIKLISNNTQEIINEIERLNCDVAFVEGECHSNMVSTTFWREDNLRVIVRANHPLAKETDITVTKLLEYPWVTREVGSGTHQLLIKALGEHIKSLKKAITLNYDGAKKQYIYNSDAVACLSELSIADSWNGDNFSKLKIKTNELDLSRNFYKLLHKNKYHTNLTETFCKFVESDI